MADSRRAIHRRDINALLEASVRRANQARAEHPQDCHLCFAWLPDQDAHAAAECRCTGCGATYAKHGSWRRVLTADDAQNPYHSALHMRRYGISAEYVRHLGWVVPPEWMTVRFPGEPVAA